MSDLDPRPDLARTSSRSAMARACWSSASPSVARSSAVLEINAELGDGNPLRSGPTVLRTERVVRG